MKRPSGTTTTTTTTTSKTKHKRNKHKPASASASGGSSDKRKLGKRKAFGGSQGGKPKPTSPPPSTPKRKRPSSKETVFTPPSREKPINANWELLKAKIASPSPGPKRAGGGLRARSGSRPRPPQAIRTNTQPTRVLALDCEMVGVGEDGSKSALARVCVCNYFGNVLIDSYCKPGERVVDFRTRYSGIKPVHIKDAPPFAEVQEKVSEVSAYAHACVGWEGA